MEKDKFFMAIRKLTVAPLIAMIFLICMFIHRFDVLSGIGQWAYCMFFIGVFPVLAYPMQRYFKAFRDKGRSSQRMLAIIFAVLGYIFCCVLNLFFASSPELWIIVLEYFISGLIIFLFNRIFRLKISGHACGITGPVLLLIHFGLYIQATVGACLIALVYIASLKTKRHSLWQPIGGSAVPAAVIACLIAILG